MEDEFMSLFDYLGRAAGSSLGQSVAYKAAEEGVEHRIKEVSNPRYSGPIMMYPKWFLDEYFSAPKED